MPVLHTQLAVVGAGPGGYAAAFYARDRGLEVTLVDAEPHPGGVCLYRGCIPSKALLHVAKLIGEARHASAWGVHYDAPRIDLDRLRAWKDGVVAKLTGGLGQLATQRKVRYVQGLAAFEDSHTLRVARAAAAGGGSETITFDHAILATGSRPARPRGLDLDSPRVMDSSAALALPDVPETLLVVGGGYIGLELGSVYAALGTRVTVVEMLSGLLPGADRDLVNVLAKQLERTFAAIRLETTVASLREEPGGIRVAFEGSGEPTAQVFDKVLVSVGRTPNSAIPGLDRTQVQRDERGFIVVDAARRTADPAIYAIGDVVGEPMLAHKASHEARVAVDAILGERVAFGGGVVRPDRDGRQGARPRGRGRAVSVGRARPRHHDGPARGPHEAPHRPDDRAHPGGGDRRGGSGRAHRRRRARGRDGGPRERPQTQHPPAPDAVRDPDGSRRSLLRAEHARVSAEASRGERRTAVNFRCAAAAAGRG